MSRAPLVRRPLIEGLENRAMYSATPVLGPSTGVSAPPPVAPIVVSAPVTGVLAGSVYSYDIDTTDENGDPRTLAATQKPAWLSIVDHGDGTATLTGAPTAADAGDAAVSIAVNDGTFTTNQNFTLTVSMPKSATLDSGALVVHGTDGGDDIHVWNPHGRPETLRVTIDDRSWNFVRSAVVSGVVYAQGGDDAVITNGDLGLYANGGDGDDQLTGGDANDTLAGGMGHDTLSGGIGDDLLLGHGGDDRFDGGDGDDRLFGNAGRDVLTGGTGSDHLDGGAGRDGLLGRDGTPDTLVGDSADDIALADDDDTHIGLLTLVA